MSHNEIKKRLLAARSAEEAASIAREDGLELSAAQAEALFREIQMRKAAEVHPLDPVELETVSGGGEGDTLPGICKATVEADFIAYEDGKIARVATSSWCCARRASARSASRRS